MPHRSKICPKCGATTSRLVEHHNREHKPKAKPRGVHERPRPQAHLIPRKRT